MSDDWGTASAASAADAWGTDGLAAALPDASHDMTETNGHDAAETDATEAAPVIQNIPEALEGWVRPTPYDYTGQAPREWDGNAAVYEWDGETGDIGPEFPELELQLFGNPAERTDSQGIDFTK